MNSEMGYYSDTSEVYPAFSEAMIFIYLSSMGSQGIPGSSPGLNSSVSFYTPGWKETVKGQRFV